MRRTLAVVGVCALAVGASGCAKPAQTDRAGRSNLTPKYKPDPSIQAALSASTTTSTSTSTTLDAGTPTTGRGRTASTTTTTTPILSGSLADRTGDVTPSPLDPPPPWADLVGARMTRGADGFELRVTLGGPAAPTTSDGDHTMNVASFFDVDGDGSVDFEVWANLADTGWGASYFDDRGHRSLFLAESGVTVAVDGAELVLRFPLSHLGFAERFQWSLASEWGKYQVLGTQAAARDDAPDNDVAARFPD